jgi:DNA-binding MarR family transcriptional regulator
MSYRYEKAKAARECTHSMRELLLGYRSLLEDALREEGLTLPQLRLLDAIRESGAVSGASLARTCQLTPQTLQAMLARAARERWIVRGASEQNHRILTASLTRKGETVLASGLAAALEIEQKIWSGISVDSLEQVLDVLRSGVTNLNVELGSQRPS